MVEQRRDDEDLNNQGDYISGATDKKGKGILVGKELSQTTTEQNLTINLPPPPPPPPPLGHLAYDHPVRQYTLADVIVALIGNPMTGEPGLVSQLQAMVSAMEIMNTAQADAHRERMKLADDIKALKNNKYTKVFQILVLAIAAILLVSFVILLLRPR